MAGKIKFKMTISKVKVNNATNNIKFKKSYFGKDYKHDNEENSERNSSEQNSRRYKENRRN